MDITPLVPKDKKNITGYGNGAFKVNNEPHEGSVIILPDSVLSWNVNDFAKFNAEEILPLIGKSNIEILIVGCGAEHTALPLDIKNTFRENHINIEVMETGAACRTYNVLLTEGREVGAALIAV